MKKELSPEEHEKLQEVHAKLWEHLVGGMGDNKKEDGKEDNFPDDLTIDSAITHLLNTYSFLDKEIDLQNALLTINQVIALQRFKSNIDYILQDNEKRQTEAEENKDGR